jgi:multiple antibiotic resistance protein
MDALLKIIVNALYFLALINPISKISVVSLIMSEERRGELGTVVMKTTLIAALILLGSMLFGDLLLRRVFHVTIHALRLSGGFVLVWIGFNALRKGVFFERDRAARFSDLAIVPLACPMIAGPATIAASITLTAQEGFLIASGSVLVAIIVNSIFMYFSHVVSRMLIRFNILGALIRIIGLIVMTIGAQMMLDGISQWMGTVSGLIS